MRIVIILFALAVLAFGIACAVSYKAIGADDPVFGWLTLILCVLSLVEGVMLLVLAGTR